MRRWSRSGTRWTSASEPLPSSASAAWAWGRRGGASASRGTANTPTRGSSGGSGPAAAGRTAPDASTRIRSSRRGRTSLSASSGTCWASDGVTTPGRRRSAPARASPTPLTRRRCRTGCCAYSPRSRPRSRVPGSRGAGDVGGAPVAASAAPAATTSAPPPADAPSAARRPRRRRRDGAGGGVGTISGMATRPEPTVPAFHRNVFFNGHHSPMGAFFSFTCGHAGTRGGLGAQLNRPADQDVYVGVKEGGRSGDGVVTSLPFFKEDLPAQGAGLVTGVATYAPDQVRRYYGWATDRWVT